MTLLYKRVIKRTPTLMEEVLWEFLSGLKTGERLLASRLGRRTILRVFMS